jgi:hypothetical protein
MIVPFRAAHRDTDLRRGIASRLSIALTRLRIITTDTQLWHPARRKGCIAASANISYQKLVVGVFLLLAPMLVGGNRG